MKPDSRYKWYIVDVVAFVTVHAVAWSYLDVSVDIASTFTPFSLFIFGLGVYRLTDIITTESVTDFIRAPFMDRKIVNGAEEFVLAERGFRGFLGVLVSCPACMGVWVAMICFYWYIFSPVTASIFLLIMALTGAERFFSKLYNFFDNQEKALKSKNK